METLGYVPGTCSKCGTEGPMQPWGKKNALICADCFYKKDIEQAQADERTRVRVAMAIQRRAAADARRTSADITHTLRRMQSKSNSMGVMLPQSLLDRLGWKQMDVLRFRLATDDDGNPIGIVVQWHAPGPLSASDAVDPHADSNTGKPYMRDGSSS